VARTVTSWANREAPSVLRFISGLPVRDVDWRALGRAQNLTHATGRHGQQFGMAWKGTGLTGSLAAGSHNIVLTLPVPDPDLARFRVRVWADAAAGSPGKVELIAPLGGTVSANSAVTGTVTRYASGVVNATPDVALDADAGHYVTMTLRAQGDFASLESVHVDSIERGFSTYPGADSTLPAGLTGGIVPIDDDETVQDAPVSSDLLFDARANLAVLADRRQVRGCWADWYDFVGGSPYTYRPNGGLAPQRIPVMLPIPQQGVMKLTLAAHVFDAPASARKVWLCTFNEGGGIDDVVAEWSLSAAGTTISTVNIPTQRVKHRYDKRCPPLGLDAYLSAALIVEGAIPQRDRLRLEGIRTSLADDDIISGGWGLSSLVLWGP